MAESQAPETCRSWSALARAVGVSKTTVQRWRRRSDWPAEVSGPPFTDRDVAALLAWRRDRLAADPRAQNGAAAVDLDDNQRRARARLLRERIATARSKIERLEHEHIEVGLVERYVCGTAGLMLDLLSGISHDLARDLSEHAAEADLTSRYQAIADAHRDAAAEGNLGHAATVADLHRQLDGEQLQPPAEGVSQQQDDDEADDPGGHSPDTLKVLRTTATNLQARRHRLLRRIEAGELIERGDSDRAVCAVASAAIGAIEQGEARHAMRGTITRHFDRARREVVGVAEAALRELGKRPDQHPQRGSGRPPKGIAAAAT